MTPVLLISVLLIAVASFLAIRFITGSAARSSSCISPTRRVDLTRYAVMQNLLNPRETIYLRRCGLSESAVRRFRNQRRRIFRVYLRNLERDTQRLFEIAEFYIREAAAEAPELSERLANARVRFRLAVWTLRWRLLLHALGADTVDVSAALGSASELLQALRTATAAQRSAAVV